MTPPAPPPAPTRARSEPPPAASAAVFVRSRHTSLPHDAERCSVRPPTRTVGAWM